MTAPTPPPEAERRGPWPRLRKLARLLLPDAAYRWFFAPDIFLSYASEDGADYTSSLRRRLGRRPRRLVCSMDIRHASVDRQVPPAVLADARDSWLRVVVVSPACLQAPGVAEEFAAFAVRPNRALLLVSFEGVRLEDAAWYAGGQALKPRRLAEPAGTAALQLGGRASLAVVEQILSAADFISQRRRIAMGAGLGATVAAVALAVAVLAGGKAVQQETIARATRLASDAIQTLALDPGATLESLDQGLESMSQAVTPLGMQALRNTLDVMPRLLLDLQLECGADSAVVDATGRHVAVAESIGSDVCVVDLDTGTVVRVSVFEARSGGGDRYLHFDQRGRLWALYGSPYMNWRMKVLHPPSYEPAAPGAELPFVADRVAFSLDRKGLALSDLFGRLYTLDLDAERPSSARRLTPAEIPKSADVEKLAFTRDGRHLLVARHSEIQLWQADHGEQTRPVAGQPVPLHSFYPPFALDPSADRLAVGFEDGLKVFDLPSFNERNGLDVRDIVALSFSPRGALVALDKHGTTHVWLTATRRINDHRELLLAPSADKALAFNTVGKTEFSFDWTGERFHFLGGSIGSRTSMASVVGIQTGQEMARLSHGYEIDSILPAARGTVVLGGGQLRLWGPSSLQGQRDAAPNSVIGEVVFDAAGTRALVHPTPNALLTSKVAARLQVVPSGSGPVAWMAPEPVAPIAMRLGTAEDAGRVDIATEAALIRSSASSPQAWQVESLAPTVRPCARVAAFAEAADAGAVASATHDIDVRRRGRTVRLNVPGWPKACIESMWMDPSGRYLALDVEMRGDALGNRLLVRDLDLDKDVLDRRVPRWGLQIAGTSQALWLTHPEKNDTDVLRHEVIALPSGRCLKKALRPMQLMRGPRCIDADARHMITTTGFALRLVRFDADGALETMATVAGVEDIRGCRFSNDGREVHYAQSAGIRSLLLSPDALLAAARALRPQQAPATPASANKR